VELGCDRIRNHSRRRIFGYQLFKNRSKLRTDTAPIGDAIIIEHHRSRVGTRVVGTDDLNRTAIAGAVLFNDHDTIIGLLASAKTRQTNHHHGDTVPFEIQCSVAALRELPGWRSLQSSVPTESTARQICPVSRPTNELPARGDCEPHKTQQLSIADIRPLKQISRPISAMEGCGAATPNLTPNHFPCSCNIHEVQYFLACTTQVSVREPSGSIKGGSRG